MASTVGEFAEDSYGGQLVYADIDPGENLSIRYGNWSNSPSTSNDVALFIVPNTTGSDYSGSLVERSNYQAFLDEYGDIPGVHTTFGGYDTFGILVESSIDDEGLLEALAALESYPVLDDSLYSEMEMEAQFEAWKSWASSDFGSALEKEFGVEIESPENPSMITLFLEAAENANEYWVNEQGSEMYIDIDRIVRDGGITREDLLEIPGVTPEFDSEGWDDEREFIEREAARISYQLRTPLGPNYVQEVLEETKGTVNENTVYFALLQLGYL